MSERGIRIERMSLRLRGVKPKQAERQAHSIAREIADSLAGEGALLGRGSGEIGTLSVRVQPNGGGRGIAEQIRRQLGSERPRE
jgi:hypothetical protein